MKHIVLRKVHGRLEPVDTDGEVALKRIGAGDLVMVELRGSRNPMFHRKLFAMLRLILHNQSHYKSVEELLGVCKIRVGLCDTVQTKFGEIKLPKSISPADMSPDEFADFYSKAVDWVVTEVIPGMQASDLNDEVAAELAGFA